ncbi:hypothetical protein [Streptomyces coeruleorubidus]|nr:hypothetical protein [Streptomyces coeruleorubidus]GGT64997.1 hypothetical protein GCM10010256_23530 [Streptomyces coeruleorubidus]
MVKEPEAVLHHFSVPLSVPLNTSSGSSGWASGHCFVPVYVVPSVSF